MNYKKVERVQEIITRERELNGLNYKRVEGVQEIITRERLLNRLEL